MTEMTDPNFQFLFPRILSIFVKPAVPKLSPGGPLCMLFLFQAPKLWTPGHYKLTV